jgi:hypothetical protein
MKQFRKSRKQFQKTRKQFRNTIKHGGFEMYKVYDCPVLKSGKSSATSTCARKFAEDNRFIIIKTVDDGNCFYDTLSKFGEKKNIDRVNRSHLVLRKELVDKLLTNKNNVAPYILYNTPAQLVSIIKELGRNGIWDNDTSDIVSQYASKVFNIILNIFDVKGGVINKITMRPLSENKSTVEVNMLRINDSHYQLLWPSPKNNVIDIDSDIEFVPNKNKPKGVKPKPKGDDPNIIIIN